MDIRLRLLASEYNVDYVHLAEFLNSKGVGVETSPGAKVALTDGLRKTLDRHYSKDLAAKKEVEQMEPTSKEERQMPLIIEQREVEPVHGLKVLGKINLVSEEKLTLEERKTRERERKERERQERIARDRKEQKAHKTAEQNVRKSIEEKPIITVNSIKEEEKPSDIKPLITPIIQTNKIYPMQKIFFGSPGTGKTHTIYNSVLPSLDIEKTSENCISVVFHPEYTYGDFMGKLMPITRDGKVEYNYYQGHFLKALAQAYKNYLENPSEPKSVALVIDEINRGNSAAIFGTVFQLLDRSTDNWSAYPINISDMEYEKLIELIGIEIETIHNKKTNKTVKKYTHKNIENPLEILKLEHTKIQLPPNLHIVGSMNTSDTSIYYMDSAFKRRWDWQFVDIDALPDFEKIDEGKTMNEPEWKTFVQNINKFLKTCEGIRKIEDKQIGYYFIKSPVTPDKIRNKLMFFLWDTVFQNDKKPLATLIGKNLVTFGDFIRNFEDFFLKIKNYK